MKFGIWCEPVDGGQANFLHIGNGSHRAAIFDSPEDAVRYIERFIDASRPEKLSREYWFLWPMPIPE